MNRYSEILESAKNSKCIKRILGMREKQKQIKNLLVEDALFRKALSGDVRACLTWLKYRMPGWTFPDSIHDTDSDIEQLLDSPLPRRDFDAT